VRCVVVESSDIPPYVLGSPFLLPLVGRTAMTITALFLRYCIVLFECIGIRCHQVYSTRPTSTLAVCHSDVEFMPIPRQTSNDNK
jgi:hypothetical protein